MNIFRTNNPKDNEKEIEAMLKSTLQPVVPRPEFTQKLGHRLFDGSVPEIEINHQGKIQTIIWIGVGILSGLVLILTNGRAIISILSTLGIWNYFKRQITIKRRTVLHTQRQFS
jgi:hypothetical protein